MSKGNTFENDLLKLIFWNEAIDGIADAAASPTDLYVSLHTSNPGEGGSQTTSEASYSGYARVLMARDNLTWDITANVVTPIADIEFPEPTSPTSQVLTYFAVGTEVSGTGKILYSGPLSPSITAEEAVKPTLDTNTSVMED